MTIDKEKGSLLLEVLLGLLLSTALYAGVSLEVRALGRLSVLHRRHDERENCLRQAIYSLSRIQQDAMRQKIRQDEQCEKQVQVRCDSPESCRITFPANPRLSALEIQTESGFTLLEVLVFLLLSASLLFGVIFSTRQTTETLLQWRSDVKLRESGERLRLLLETWVKRANNFRLPGGVSMETAASGSQFAHALRNSKYPPPSGEPVIIFRLLDPKRVLIRETGVHPFSASSLAWCRQTLRLPETFPPSDPPTHKAAVLLSLDRLVDVEVELRRLDNNARNCPYRSELTGFPRSLYNDAELPPEKSWMAIIGIDEEFAIYRDEENRVRKASLVSQSNDVIAGPFRFLELKTFVDTSGRRIALSLSDSAAGPLSFTLSLPPEETIHPADLVF